MVATQRKLSRDARILATQRDTTMGTSTRGGQMEVDLQCILWVQAVDTLWPGEILETSLEAKAGTLELAGKSLPDHNLYYRVSHRWLCVIELSTTEAPSVLKVTAILPSTDGLATLWSSTMSSRVTEHTTLAAVPNSKAASRQMEVPTMSTSQHAPTSPPLTASEPSNSTGLSVKANVWVEQSPCRTTSTPGREMAWILVLTITRLLPQKGTRAVVLLTSTCRLASLSKIIQAWSTSDYMGGSCSILTGTFRGFILIRHVLLGIW